MRTKPYLYKRFIAYIIDLLIITLLSGIFTIIFTDSTNYNNDTNKLLELVQNMASGELTEEEYYNEFNEINYNLTKNSISVTIITIGVTIVYYVVMSYYCNGITLGKYIMKIKIVSANKKKLNIFNYFLRSLIINNVLSNIVTIILVSVLSKQTFIGINSQISNLFTLLFIITFIFAIYRDDGRGLHDLMANTKIINIKDELEETSEVQEAIVTNEISNSVKNKRK